ncbi:glycerol dehydratase reactivase beta/small subunit family protein [Modestobacter sp. VKM Ac-2978]|uniref:glycerol dehydratase reactivase beta/small subunit family protein n=1 Tax=Modestobacter sp. VKM Ac-2978 TaxID=3004132 RepID=UPI0022AA370A|nr:glycerol dehydratase reactivase beta/small subunit family protein [Modestobacter sp. VKM Ac-2978]MCZ2846469.1 glycerol dehydratase reactivase beta/small subunit family protein [Modestobacter sp. VKM Ac-2978]
MPGRVTDARQRPAVLVHRSPAAPAAVLREVCAGAEEEGVPTDVVDAPDQPADAVGLAHAAARDSQLEVGVGVDAAGAVAVHHGKLPPHRPATTTGPDAGPRDWRRTGRTAARIVKGLPLG